MIVCTLHLVLMFITFELNCINASKSSSDHLQYKTVVVALT